MATILIVDDIADNRQLLRFDLEDDHHKVIEAADGYACLEKVESEQPDLILLDMMMPNMNGIETLEAIRKMEGYSKIPAIFLTARASVNQNEELLDAGALDVIVKPFDPLELGREVKQLLSGASVSS